jgi:hypothetical protein
LLSFFPQEGVVGGSSFAGSLLMIYAAIYMPAMEVMTILSLYSYKQKLVGCICTERNETS